MGCGLWRQAGSCAHCRAGWEQGKGRNGIQRCIGSGTEQQQDSGFDLIERSSRRIPRSGDRQVGDPHQRSGLAAGAAMDIDAHQCQHQLVGRALRRWDECR
jgi:hypothetical protein